MINRDRVINAVLFFAQKTKFCGKIKLFKLLYLLDFEHFKQTGKSVTGYEYEAWKFGPVPASLMEEWEQFEADLSAAVHIEQELVIDFVRQTVKPNGGVEFNDEDFSPRQLRIMTDLANQHELTKSPAMIDVTHVVNGAWDKVWNKGAGARKPIPYELAIPDSDIHRDQLLAMAAERKMYAASFTADIGNSLH
jgi:uncharacterized phage-associated protein